MRIYHLSCLAFLICFALSTDSFYKKITHYADPEAKCLDGSPAILYVHEGGDTKNILIYFFGGGYCGSSTLADTIQNCYQRSKTILGSSIPWPAQIDDSIGISGYLSVNPAISRFANWTKIILPYCDGAFHQGYAETPLKYKDTELFFRGSRITKAHLQWINGNYGLEYAQKVVLTGSSAGGIATFLWSNYLRDLVDDPLRVYTIPDSGVFMNSVSNKTGTYRVQMEFQNLFKLVNRDLLTPNDICNRFYEGEEWKCWMIEYAYNATAGRILLINSEYDSWAIQNLIEVNCLIDGKSGKSLANCNISQMKLIEDYRNKFYTFVGNFLQYTKNSIWAISCSNHVYTPLDAFYNVSSQKVPMTTGSTVRAAVEKFVFDNGRVTAVDGYSWPYNA